MVRAGQQADAHEELVHDFAAGKLEGLFEELHPFFFCFGVMRFEPGFEGAVRFLQLQNGFGIFDGGFYFEAVADDARIGHEALTVGFGIGGYFFELEVVVSFAEGGFLLEDGFPAEAGLVDLEHEAAEELVIVVDGKAVGLIVVGFVDGPALVGHGGDGVAIGHKNRFCGKDAGLFSERKERRRNAMKCSMPQKPWMAINKIMRYCSWACRRKVLRRAQ